MYSSEFNNNIQFETIGQRDYWDEFFDFVMTEERMFRQHPEEYLARLSRKIKPTHHNYNAINNEIRRCGTIYYQYMAAKYDYLSKHVNPDLDFCWSWASGFEWTINNPLEHRPFFNHLFLLMQDIDELTGEERDIYDFIDKNMNSDFFWPDKVLEDMGIEDDVDDSNVVFVRNV